MFQQNVLKQSHYRADTEHLTRDTSLWQMGSTCQLITPFYFSFSLSVSLSRTSRSKKGKQPFLGFIKGRRRGEGENRLIGRGGGL